MDDVKKDKNEKDRLFFHDLVNHTHGLLLFLGQKSDLNASEVDLIKSEIKILQALIQEHYQFVHKNLDFFESEENQHQKIKSTLEKLVSFYFPKESVQIEIKLEGKEGSIDFIPLYRILNNIVKNMAEAKIANAQFLIEFGPRGLSITTNNQITDKNARNHSEGLGLLSIASLANEAGGVFQHEIHGDVWVNHICLPYKNSSSIKKIAA